MEITQDYVAALCNIGKRTYVYWESGEREFPFSKLSPLVEKYGLDLNWLMTGKGEMLRSSSSDELRERIKEIRQLRSELKKIDSRLEELDEKSRRRSDRDDIPGVESA